MAVTDVPLALHRGESDVHTARSYLDETGNVTMVIDAALIRDVYLRACEGQGLGRPSVIGVRGHPVLPGER
jgi:hypothetical protein